MLIKYVTLKSTLATLLLAELVDLLLNVPLSQWRPEMRCHQICAKTVYIRPFLGKIAKICMHRAVG